MGADPDEERHPRRAPRDLGTLNSTQWARFEPLIPPPRKGGRPRTVDMRGVVNALLYLLHTGCPWARLPEGFPPRSTVHEYYRQWRIDGDWPRILHQLLLVHREMTGREPSPSAVILDAESLGAATSGPSAWTRRAAVQRRKPRSRFAGRKAGHPT